MAGFNLDIFHPIMAQDILYLILTWGLNILDLILGLDFFKPIQAGGLDIINRIQAGVCVLD